jgi:hypothetical protein
MLTAITFSFDTQALFKCGFNKTPWCNQFADGKIITIQFYLFSVSITTLRPKVNIP